MGISDRKYGVHILRKPCIIILYSLHLQSFVTRVSREEDIQVEGGAQFWLSKGEYEMIQQVNMVVSYNRAMRSL